MSLVERTPSLPGRAFWRCILLSAVAILAIVLEWWPRPWEPFQSIERLVRDQALVWNTRHHPESRLVVIDIDENSLSGVGPWPWSRDQIASLVETLLADYSVQHVGLDIVFPAPADEAGDIRLQALAQTGKLTLAQVFDLTHRETPLSSGTPVHMAATDQIPLARLAIPASGFIANHEGLSQAACVGNIGIQPDSDGSVRQVPLAVEWKNQYSPLLPLAMLMCDSRRLDGLPQLPKSLIASRPWPVEYTRSWDSYTVISAADIQALRVNPRVLKDAWVLVGSSALGLNDRATTPLGETVAGVMVHAATLSVLLDWVEGHHFTSRPVWGKIFASLMIVLSLGLVAWMAQRWRAWALLPLMAGLGGVWLLVALALLRLHYPLQITPPFWALSCVFLLAPMEWWGVQREQGRLLRTFATYVAPSVLQQMLRQGVDQPLVPRYAEITVLSADMQGYSVLTNQGSLEDAAVLTTGFLDCLTQPLLETGGTLDKYTGDGLVGFWGAPLPVASHTDQAVEAALQMLKRVRQWNQERIAQGLPAARLRIGIESGVALVGDLGTDFRRTYTAVGDCINFASKFQAAAKHYNHDLLIGPNASAQVRIHELIRLEALDLPSFPSPQAVFTVQGASHSLVSDPL